MSDDKNLRETLKDAMEETSDTSNASNDETKEELSSKAVETNSDETTEPEYVAGIDISGYSEAEKTLARKVLGEKGKLLEKGYQKKFEEISSLKKTKDYLEQIGVTEDEVQKALSEYVYRKQNPTPKEQKTALKTLDKLIEQAPPEQKANLEQFRTIVAEETNTSELQKEVRSLKEQISHITQSAASGRIKVLEAELENLSSEYGEDLITKHRRAIIEQGQKYNVPAENLLFAIAPLEVKKALSAKMSSKKTVSEKKNAVSSQPNSAVSNVEFDSRKTKWKDLLSGIVSKGI